MKIFLRIIAVVLILFGLLSVLSGGTVLLGFKEPHYSPYPLIIFYTSMGFVELFVSTLIWRAQNIKVIYTLLIASAHLLAVALLLWAVNDSAIQSIIGMSVRCGLWSIASLSVFFYNQKN